MRVSQENSRSLPRIASPDGVAAGGANFLEVAVGVKQAVLAADYEGVVYRAVAVQHDRVVLMEVEQHIDQLVGAVDTQHAVVEIVEAR